MAAANRLMPGLSKSARSPKPKKSINRLLKKIGSPPGVIRLMWTGTMSTSCESSRSRAQCLLRSHFIIDVDGNGVPLHDRSTLIP